MNTSKTFRTTIVRNAGMCFIPLPFDPKPVFGKVRAPVTVTLNGYTYRSTIATMGGPPCIPADLVQALKTAGALERWRALSYSHQREHVEAVGAAKKPDARARRIAAAVEMIRSKAPA